MPNNIVPFRKDFAKTLARLVKLHPGMSSQELLDRHTQILNLRYEGYRLMDIGLAKIEDVDPVTNALHAFHAIARNAGIQIEIIKVFNSERLDWKMFKADRETWPKHQRT
ncbi:hypothetical protein [Methylobacterium bullatum]|uniref:hypothetical protein n=1 Tax=Methylobacterium bullatum TaxID=570505 RepID=UPI0030D5025C